MTDFSAPTPAFPQEVIITSPEGALAKISPYGAHVLSWVPAQAEERLFLSPKAEFRAGAAIRGGVPVIFPQFSGLGSLPKHGFARTSPWNVVRADPASAVFRLSETPATYSLWPHRFLAEYNVRISKNELEMALALTNTDLTPFSFTAALHTYLRVKDVRTAAVLGLQGCRYLDETHARQEMRGEALRVTFAGEVDRTYLDSPSRLQLVDASHSLAIHAAGFPDTVVWNPGPEKCATLADMEENGYLQFVCVEAAAAGQPVRLAPGETWRGTQLLVA